MGTAHGAEELGLCPHGLAYQAGAWGRYIGFCLGYGHIRKIQTNNGRQKYSARPITLSHDGILTNNLLRVKRRTLEMRITVSREYIAQRTRALLTHTYGANFFRLAFSTCMGPRKIPRPRPQSARIWRGGGGPNLLVYFPRPYYTSRRYHRIG
jgi:hypothetical protein